MGMEINLHPSSLDGYIVLIIIGAAILSLVFLSAGTLILVFFAPFGSAWHHIGKAFVFVADKLMFGLALLIVSVCSAIWALSYANLA